MVPDYAPVAFVENGEFKGVEADLARQLTADYGVQIEFVESRVDELIPALQAGQIDVIMSGMSETFDRKAQVDFCDSYKEVGQMALVRKVDFTRLSDEVASRDASLPVDELVANLRSSVMQRWTPPGGGYHGALNHVVIHGLDVTAPLGASRCSPDETIRVVLDDLAAGGGHTRFGVAIDGRHLQASDLDWSHGSGPVLRGAAGDLALALCGRAVPAGRLRGDPLPRS